MQTHLVALIGDCDPDVTAHRAIPLAIGLASRKMIKPVLVNWLPTESLVSAPNGALSQYAGFWCVPASPYRSMEGALRAIQFALEQGRPFLGTCGGFQHALIEYARSVLGLFGADHQESNPTAQFPLIRPLQCALVEVEGRIFLQAGSRAAQVYGKTVIDEPYRCRSASVPRRFPSTFSSSQSGSTKPRSFISARSFSQQPTPTIAIPTSDGWRSTAREALWARASTRLGNGRMPRKAKIPRPSYRSAPVKADRLRR
jgi:CTP synthase (UTP-ammonia lyase)